MNEPEPSSTGYKFKRPPVDPDDLFTAKVQAAKAGLKTIEWIGLAIRNQAAAEQAVEAERAQAAKKSLITMS